jgi:hypothetical protein
MSGKQDDSTGTTKSKPMSMRELAALELEIRQQAENEERQQRILAFNADLVAKAAAWIDWTRLSGVAAEAARLFLDAYGSVRKDDLDAMGETREVYADDSAFQALQTAYGDDPRWVGRNLKSINFGIHLAKTAIHNNYPKS